jgi:hypothetical protein
MKAVVVYESRWGNTQAVAEEVAQGFLEADEDIEVAVRRAGEATPSDLADVDLLVAGAPTHVRGMSSARSRRMGLGAEAKRANSAGPATEAEGPGIRDWLKAVPKVSGLSAASCDTAAPAASLSSNGRTCQPHSALSRGRPGGSRGRVDGTPPRGAPPETPIFRIDACPGERSAAQRRSNRTMPPARGSTSDCLVQAAWTKVHGRMHGARSGLGV